MRITPTAINEEIKLLQTYSGDDENKCILKYIKHVSGKQSLYKLCLEIEIA